MMLRYVFAKKFYPPILNVIFTLVNLTRTKQGIGPVKDNSLLISAKEAAEKLGNVRYDYDFRKKIF